MASCDRLVEFEQVCHAHQVPDGDSCISLGVDQERGRDVLDRPQGRIFPGPHSFRFLIISPDCAQWKS